MVTSTCNEVGSIGRLIGAVLTLPESVDVLVVDDSYPDGTGEVVAAAAVAHPDRVRPMTRSERSGLGRAYLDGFTAAVRTGYPQAIEIDADGSHDPVEIPRMLPEFNAGADMVIGSRDTPGGFAEELGSPWCKLLSRVAGGNARQVTRIAVTDSTGGFRAFRSTLLTEFERAPSRRPTSGCRLRACAPASMPGPGSPKCRSTSTPEAKADRR